MTQEEHQAIRDKALAVRAEQERYAKTLLDEEIRVFFHELDQNIQKLTQEARIRVSRPYDSLDARHDKWREFNDDKDFWFTVLRILPDGYGVDVCPNTTCGYLLIGRSSYWLQERIDKWRQNTEVAP